MWTRDVPKVDGYYWAKERMYQKHDEYDHAQIVLLQRAFGNVFVHLIGSDEDGNARAFLWYDNALMFVPPAFNTHDAIRLGVTI